VLTAAHNIYFMGSTK